MATCFVSSLSFNTPSLAVRPPHLNRYLPPLPTPSSERLHFQPLLTAVRSRNFSGYRSLVMSSAANTEATGVPRSVPVRVAHELLQAGHRYLDVRTEEEFRAGHAAGAINVPYMFKIGSGMAKNPNFLEEVSSHFGKDDEIIVGCQSGKRSLMAATYLSSAGFTGITDIAGGYSAWRQNGLPTE